MSDKGETFFTLDSIVNSVYEGDCLEYMRRFPDNSIDMVMCDLPYGMTRNKWDSIIPLGELWKEYGRIVKDTGAIVLTSQGLFTAELILSNRKMFRYKWVWEKSKPTNFLNAGRQPLRKHEDICVFYKKPPVYHPQMVNGNPYDKGFRKNSRVAVTGIFVLFMYAVTGNDIRSTSCISRRRKAVERSSILRRNLLTLDVILSGPIQIRVT